MLDLLVTEREGALAEATRLRHQLHQLLLLQLDPEDRTHVPSLTTEAGLLAVERSQAGGSRALDQTRAAAVRRTAQRLRLALSQAEELAKQIAAQAQAHFRTLTDLKGVGLLTAGALAGILGPGRRFATEAQLAAYAGVAPLAASSAALVRHRLNRGGNRRLNAILHRIALSQVRSWPPAQAYLARRLAQGKTRREAIRALKRFVVRARWRPWQACSPVSPTSYLPAAA